MFGWLFGDKRKGFEEEVKKSFSAVKEDINKAGDWIKHLDSTDKQLFKLVEGLKEDLSSVQAELNEIKSGLFGSEKEEKTKQVFKKLPVLEEQTAVGAVQKAVQTPVQTGNFYGILQGLSANERLLVFTLMNSDEGMKLSYEDLAMLLGKERSTIRGHINRIKQKSEGLIEEMVEKNGKKRVFVPEEVRNKLVKYAKVRVRGGRKG